MNIQSVFLQASCLKILAAVEADPNVSGQHEFNGTAEMKSLLGSERRSFPAKFFVRGNNVTDEVNVTWYDSREKDPNRSEFRLYFQTNAVMNLAAAGDNMLIGFDSDKILNFLLIRSTG